MTSPGDERSSAHDVPLIPDRSADDDDAGWGERTGDDDATERYLRERPPHHGD
jgi:hypothetical protein